MSDDDSAAGSPSAVDRLVVHAEDVLRALEVRARGRRNAVLRVTPPFTARTRARLHVAGAELDPSYDAVHLKPTAFADEPPAFPTSDDAADGPNLAAQRERHVVEQWRRAVADGLRTRLDHPRLGDVSVSYLSLETGR